MYIYIYIYIHIYAYTYIYIGLTRGTKNKGGGVSKRLDDDFLEATAPWRMHSLVPRRPSRRYRRYPRGYRRYPRGPSPVSTSRCRARQCRRTGELPSHPIARVCVPLGAAVTCVTETAGAATHHPHAHGSCCRRAGTAHSVIHSPQQACSHQQSCGAAVSHSRSRS